MEQDFDISYVYRFIPKLLSTLGTTLTIVAGAAIVGLVIGLLVALPRLYQVPVLRRISRLYVSFFRGTPVLIQLFLLYYGLPEFLKPIGIDVSKTPALVFVTLSFGLHAAAFVSETIRGSVVSVDRGQVEAAYAIGMTGYQAFSRIVSPQALAIAVPVFANQLLALLKDTSLAFTLGVMELTGKASSLTALTQHFVEAYLSLALVYLAMSTLLERLLKRAELHLLKHEKPVRAVKERIGGWIALARRFAPAGWSERKEVSHRDA